MRMIVLSDSHGDLESVRRIITRHREDGDIFIHLGDGVSEFRKVSSVLTDKQIYYVPGNHEDAQTVWSRSGSRVFEAEGHWFFLAHGHRYNVKLDLLHLLFMGKKEGADVILYGHTHTADDRTLDGVRLINPGAIRYPRGAGASYCVIDVDSEGIDVKFESV